jgi:hypothetical protein
VRANEWEMRGLDGPRIPLEQTPAELEAEEEWLERKAQELRPTIIQRAQSGIRIVLQKVGLLRS